MADESRAHDVLRELLAAITAVEHCRFCCVAADEDCHKTQFEAAIRRAKQYLHRVRQEALSKPS